MRRAFTLIELLVVIAVIGLLLGIMLPALASSREAARSTRCAGNLAQIYLLVRTYADENRGVSPALGRPYDAPPNWALVVQQAAGMTGGNADELYVARSVLVCPSARAFYSREMTRTYAINATGHAGKPGDRDDFDSEAATAHLRLELIALPSAAAILVDGSIPTVVTGAPPTRTASVLDFRDEAHVRTRIGRFHGPRGDRYAPLMNATRFNTVYADGHASITADVPEMWLTPMP